MKSYFFITYFLKTGIDFLWFLVYYIYNQYGEDVTYNFEVYTSAYQLKSEPSDKEIQEFQSRINIKARNIMIKSYGAKMEYMEKMQMVKL